jgi:hypothetical protein
MAYAEYMAYYSLSLSPVTIYIAAYMAYYIIWHTWHIILYGILYYMSYVAYMAYYSLSLSMAQYILRHIWHIILYGIHGI